MNEKELTKILQSGYIYDPNLPEVMTPQQEWIQKVNEYNMIPAGMENLPRRLNMLKNMFAKCGDNVYFEPPFHANMGGHFLKVGNNVYANFNLTLVDDSEIVIEDNVMIAPNVTICTATHPISPELRKVGIQYNKKVHICKNVWIGAGVIILPGVTIGENSVIGAGSLVDKDIPANVVAYGHPCKVQRPITEQDYKIYDHNKVIDEKFTKK